MKIVGSFGSSGATTGALGAGARSGAGVGDWAWSVAVANNHSAVRKRKLKNFMGNIYGAVGIARSWATNSVGTAITVPCFMRSGVSAFTKVIRSVTSSQVFRSCERMAT
jgi:hypothetical protein